MNIIKMDMGKMNMGKMEKNEVKKICKADCKVRVQIPSSDVNRPLRSYVSGLFGINLAHQATTNTTTSPAS